MSEFKIFFVTSLFMMILIFSHSCLSDERCAKELVVKQIEIPELTESGVYQLLNIGANYFNIYSIGRYQGEGERTRMLRVLTELYERIRPLDNTHYEKAKANQLKNAIIDIIERITKENTERR